MSRWLVGSSSSRICGAGAGHEREEQARLLAARQVAGEGLGLVAGQAESAEMAAQLGLVLLGPQVRQLRQGAAIVGQGIGLVLGEVADAQLAGADRLARFRFELAGQQAHEGRLAVAVGAQQRDAVLAVDAQPQARQNRAAGFVADGDIVQRDQWRRQGFRLGEAEAWHLLLDDAGDRLHACQGLEARLGLARLGGLVAEAVDEGLDMLALGLLARVHGRDALQPRPAGRLEAVVVAVVERQPAAFEVHGLFRHGVQQAAVVGDQDQGAGRGLEVALKPECRLQVQVVGRLVQEQQVGRREEQGGQGDAHAPAARQGVDGTLLGRLVEAEAGQDLGRPGRRALGADRGQALVDLGQAVGRGGLGGGQQLAALAVGDQDGLQQTLRAARRLLGDRADPRRPRHDDLAQVGLQLAGQQLQQGRLAAAVAADQADPPALVQAQRGVLEQRASGHPVAHAFDADHGLAG